MDLKLVTVIDARNPVVGDLFLDETGTIPLVDGPEAIVQHVIIRLKRIKGEWFLNLKSGVPWDELLGKGADVGRTKRVVSKVITSTPGIATLDRIEVELDAETRVLHISSIEATTIDGAVLGPDDFGPMEIKL